MDRRDWIKNSGLAAGLLSLSSFDIPEKHLVQWEGKRILFQGDSITDAGRNREASGTNQPSALGSGYAFLAAASVLRNQPPYEFEFYNKGISGNKVFQLIERWEEDALALKPDLLSILIGVNDYWHTLTGGYEGTVEVYKADFRKLLDISLEANPDMAIMIGEPFIVKGGTAVSEDWYPEFGEYQSAALEIAKEYNTGFVPYQGYFDKALLDAPVSYWCPDGVHPSMAGSLLMAEAWIETFKRM